MATGICCSHFGFAQQNFKVIDEQLKNKPTDSAKGIYLLELYKNFANPDSIVKLVLTLKTHFEQSNNKTGTAWMVYRLSTVFVNVGDFNEGYEMGLHALKMFENQKDTFGIINSINITANALDQNDHAAAIDYYKKILYYTQYYKSPVDEIYAKLNIASSYLNNKNPDGALPWLKQTLEYALAKNDDYVLGVAYSNLGLYHQLKNNLPEYLQYIKKSMWLVEDWDLPGKAESEIQMADAFFENKLFDSSKIYAYRAMYLSQQNNYKSSLAEAYSGLHKNYDLLKNADSSLKYLKLSIEIKDSIFNEEKSRKILSLAFNEQVRQQEIAAQQAMAAQNRKNNLQMLFIALFIITFLIGVVALGVMNIKRRTMESLSIVGLLLFFEFINMLLSPYISTLTNNIPALIMLGSITLATLLAPIHRILTRWMRQRIASNAEKKK